MSEETRRSPWLPVADMVTPEAQSPRSGAVEHSGFQAGPPLAAEDPEPMAPLTDPVLPYAPPPASEAPPVRRASVLSPYLVTRASQPDAPAEPVASSAYSSAHATVSPADAWNSGPASVPVPAVGLSPALGNSPSEVDSGLHADRPVIPGQPLRGRVPRPVEADDVEVIRPILPPPASEILPSSGSLPTLEPPDDEYDRMRQALHSPIGPESDPFRALGESAVASASLSAAGARTHVPVEWEGEDSAPTLSDAAPFVPMFAPAVSHDSAPDRAPEPDPEPSPTVVPPAPWTQSAGIATVQAGTELTAPTRGAGVPTRPVEDDLGGSKPWWRKLWLLIAAGVLVVGGLGFLTYRLFLMPEPIILPAPVVTEAPPAPTIEPVEVTEPSDLLAAMPREVSTLVMTSYVSLDVIGDESVPGRAAEHLVLTYGASPATDTFTIDVYQFYNSTEAQTAFEVWVEGQSELVDVTVDGIVVGQRAMVPGGAADTMAWRNETVVFVMQGPSDELLEFYSYFGY